MCSRFYEVNTRNNMQTILSILANIMTKGAPIKTKPTAR
nr:MAG TPA: hypothetical protein [Caudoviricetes sp.]